MVETHQGTWQNKGLFRNSIIFFPPEPNTVSHGGGRNVDSMFWFFSSLLGLHMEKDRERHRGTGAGKTGWHHTAGPPTCTDGPEFTFGPALIPTPSLPRTVLYSLLRSLSWPSLGTSSDYFFLLVSRLATDTILNRKTTFQDRRGNPVTSVPTICFSEFVLFVLQASSVLF